MNLNKLLFSICALLILSVLPASSEESKAKLTRDELKERVNELIAGNDNVILRRNVGEVYMLADIYLGEGNDKDAKVLLEAAMRVDGRNYFRQVELAELLLKQGDKKQAAGKFEAAYRYSENEALIQRAEEALKKNGKVPAYKPGPKAKRVKNIEIVLVPVGKVNTVFLNELKEELQAKTGIAYSISGKTIDPGYYDRMFDKRYVQKTVDAYRSMVSEGRFKEIMEQGGIIDADLETHEGRLKFIDAFNAAQKMSPENIQEQKDAIAALSGRGQLDANRLISLLRANFTVDDKSDIRGYLGVTEKDIYANDSNFLFGNAGQGFGVMSYHRFTAAFNDEKDDRPRLVKRALKQAVSSTFFILGIARCTTPECIRAYPHSLEEHDQKGDEICEWCTEQLKNAAKK